MTEQVTRAIGGAAALMDQSDALLRTRIETEAQWVHTQGQRMDELTAVWRTELNSLRDAEAVRGQAAVDRLDTLQAAVAQHLAMLGSALEAPPHTPAEDGRRCAAGRGGGHHAAARGNDPPERA